jgi:acyl carrier protein
VSADSRALVEDALRRRPEVADLCIVDTDIGRGAEVVVVVALSEFCPGAVLRELCYQADAEEAANWAVVIVPGTDLALPLTDGSAIELAQRCADVVRYDEPGTDEEVAVARIVSRIVGLGRVSMSDHFLNLGGDSLGLIHLVNAIEDEFDVLLDIEDVLGASNLRDVAYSIYQARQAGDPSDAH